MKDRKSNLNTPRKANVRITFIYNSYYDGNLKRHINSSSIVTPLSTADRIPGFYLSDIATGLCLEHTQNIFVFGYRCSKFKVYHYLLHDEFGRCLQVGSEGNIVSASCSKLLSSQAKDGLILRGNSNLNVYKMFSGSNALPGNKLYLVSPAINIAEDLLATDTKFGWAIHKEKIETYYYKTGRISSFVDDQKNLQFSLRYPRTNDGKSSIYIASGNIKRTGDLVVLKKYDARFFLLEMVQGFTKVKDMFGNIGYCYNKLCTIKSIEATTVINFIKNPRLYFDDLTQNINYIRIMNKETNNMVVMTGIDCKNQVGQDKLTAMKSCKAIKDYCKAATSGYFWIGGDKMENFHRVYCEMDTDGGGWMRLLHSVVPEIVSWNLMSDANMTDDITEWFESNYTKYLTSPVGLNTLNVNYVKYDEIRFYCRTDIPGYVSHFKTLKKNYFGYAAVRYFRSEVTTILPQMCKSFHTFEDDNTYKGTNCAKIGPNTDGTNGHWSISNAVGTNKRIYQNVYVQRGIASWGLNQIRCHTHSGLGNAQIKNGTFEISIR